MHWSRDTLLIKLRLYNKIFFEKNNKYSYELRNLKKYFFNLNILLKCRWKGVTQVKFSMFTNRKASLELFSTHCPLKERSLIFDAQPLSHSFKIKNLSCLKHVTWLEIWDLNSVLRFDFLILNSVLDFIFWSSIQFLLTFLL